MTKNELDNYSPSRILRRCGQLGIPFEDILKSPFFNDPNRKNPKSKIQYQDGVNGTIGWGKNKKPLSEKDIVPFDMDELRKLLGLLNQSAIYHSMKKEIMNQTILKYLKHLNNSKWILNEAYKFEFANYIHSNSDFGNQTDEQILSILLKSQTIKYDKSKGIQFILKSGRETLSIFLRLHDVTLFRQFQNSDFESIDWSDRSMSYTALSAWLSSLFPDKIFPVPVTGFNETINYLFDTDLEKFPKTGENYILACREFMQKTMNELKNYPFEEIHLKVWNKYFQDNPELNIKPKSSFDKVDWNWLTQDFQIFIYRKVLNLYNQEKGNIKPTVVEDFEPVGVEGNSILATHMRYERNNALIKKIKENAVKSNPMMNCEVCGFSFFEKYGELGQGFIEAHHKKPLSESKEIKTTKEDIALVCSNCHRMLHKGKSQIETNMIMTIKELKELMND